MKVPLSWLREFAPISGTSEEIAEQLTELGMELESITTFGDGLDGIVVARVLEVREHPDADRIRLVDVDRGDGVALQICCGATNMVAGDLVPLATIGTIMPSGMEIARRKMRGQESNGMLCSAAELELGEDHGGILVLGEGLQPGTAVTDALELVSDVVYEFDSLPNRPDTLSIMGVARDLAARQGVPFAVPAHAVEESGVDASERCSVRIVDSDLCGRFVARVLSGVTVGPSPRWLAQRLVAAGMRPINNVVDVSNYVMLELGQPNHTYDLAKLPSGAIAVRWARDGETIVTLDGAERTLRASDGVIVDADDAPIGIAGVMGGASTEISGTTTEICLELAWWNPEAIAATSARLNLHSEASLRFKRGVDPTIAPLAARRFASLLAEVSDAQLHPGTVDVDGDLPGPTVVPVRVDAVNALLGTNLSLAQVSGLLEPIGFASEADEAGHAAEVLSVSVPPWRPDCSIEVDVIEEVARHHGYANLARTVPVSPHTGELTATQRDRRVLRNVLVGAGLSEAMPMPFLAPGDLERCGLAPSGLVLANPLAAEESILRTSLLPGLLASVAHNERHRQRGVRLYELGRVFGLGDQGVITGVAASELVGRVLSGEAEHLAVVLAGAEAPAAVRLVESLIDSVHRGPVSLAAEPLAGLHPGRSALVRAGDVAVGQVGEVDPGVLERLEIEERVAWIQLDLGQLFALDATVPIAAPVSRYPSTDIDLAFVASDDVPASAVRATIESAAGELLASLDLFDVFRSEQLGGSSRSLAFRLRLQAADRTLTDTEVATLRQRVVDAVSAAHGATLRT